MNWVKHELGSPIASYPGSRWLGKSLGTRLVAQHNQEVTKNLDSWKRSSCISMLELVFASAKVKCLQRSKYTVKVQQTDPPLNTMDVSKQHGRLKKKKEQRKKPPLPIRVNIDIKI